VAGPCQKGPDGTGLQWGLQIDLSLPDGNDAMRLILRILGTWFLGLAVILLVIDGTKSLGANALVYTPLIETWTSVHLPSLEAVRGFIGGRFFQPLLEPAFEALLGFPSFAVIGVPGILFAFAGRTRFSRRYVRQDQI
jgi:hypothetical protein